jgi:hypothetical protein
MSRNAASCEHFASFPYFIVVTFPRTHRVINDKTLPFVQQRVPKGLPKARFGQHCSEGSFCSVNSTPQGCKNPIHPRGDVNRRFLRPFQNV